MLARLILVNLGKLVRVIVPTSSRAVGATVVNLAASAILKEAASEPSM
jgi:hypothetical protein